MDIIDLDPELLAELVIFVYEKRGYTLAELVKRIGICRSQGERLLALKYPRANRPFSRKMREGTQRLIYNFLCLEFEKNTGLFDQLSHTMGIANLGQFLEYMSSPVAPAEFDEGEIDPREAPKALYHFYLDADAGILQKKTAMLQIAWRYGEALILNSPLLFESMDKQLQARYMAKLATVAKRLAVNDRVLGREGSTHMVPLLYDKALKLAQPNQMKLRRQIMENQINALSRAKQYDRALGVSNALLAEHEHSANGLYNTLVIGCEQKKIQFCIQVWKRMETARKYWTQAESERINKALETDAETQYFRDANVSGLAAIVS